MAAVFFAAVFQLFLGEEPDGAGLFAGHIDAVAQNILKHEHLTEHTPGQKMLQNGAVAPAVYTLHDGGAGH